MSFSDSSTDGAYLAEAMAGNYLNAAGVGIWRMYQQGGLCAAANSVFASDSELRGGAVKTRWSAGDYGMVWWWAHGSETSAMLGYGGCGWETLFSSSDAPSLDNGHPSFVYQCSCTNGYPESSGNLGTALLNNGAIAAVCASRVSWYMVGSFYPYLYYKDNAGIGYFYGEQLASLGKSAGEALFAVKSAGGAGFGAESWMNLFDFNLYGDPSTSLLSSNAPGITVSYPNGGETLPTGAIVNITWSSTGTVGDVKIEYSTNNGGAWSTIAAATANDGSYSWTVPAVTSSQCLVRISEAADGMPIDSSDSVFSIAVVAETLTAPSNAVGRDVTAARE